MSVIQIESRFPFNKLLDIVEQLNLSDLEQLMSRIIALQARYKAPSLPKQESELLIRINKGLPSDIQKRFDELVARRQDETLTPGEQRELISLAEKIEKSDAERVRYISELARLRGVSPDSLMKDMKLYSPSYA